MKKTLLYYWYVHKQWNDLYDFHFDNLQAYKDVFDEEIFIISRDKTTEQEKIDRVENRIKEIFPNAQFEYYDNNPELRESLWFFNEVAAKLKQWPDNWYFFAHNKGVDTFYKTPDDCRRWIAAMYFMNLHDMEEIEKEMNSDETCVIGTYLIRNLRAWPWLKYRWHFSGTYWWFNPKKAHDIITKYKSVYPPNNRYFTEGFWGSVIPDEERYRKPSLLMYGANHNQKFNWMNDELIQKIREILPQYQRLFVKKTPFVYNPGHNIVHRNKNMVRKKLRKYVL